MAVKKTKKNNAKKTPLKNNNLPEVEIVASKKGKDKSNTNKGGKKKEKPVDCLGRDKSKVEARIAKNKALILEKLKKSGGIVTNAIAKVNIDNTTFYKWFKEDTDFARAVEEIQDAYDIIVEDKLKKLIEKDDGHSIRFYLSHRVAKYRPKLGFGQDPDAKPIELIIERYDPKIHGKKEQV